MTANNQQRPVPASRHDRDRRIGLVALDIDGTLLDTRERLSPGAEEAVRETRRRGVRVTLVSGRIQYGVLPFARQLQLDTPFISSGGACLIEPLDGRVIDCRPLDRADLSALIALARRERLPVFVSLPDGLYYEAPDGYQPRDYSIPGLKIIRTADLLHETQTEATKVTIAGELTVLAGIAAELRQQGRQLNLAYASQRYLDATRLGADKGSALLRLAAYLGTPPDHILAIGDADNDLSMFRAAGLAVAMGNAPPEVKAAAQVVAPSNDEGGVAWALHEFILNARPGSAAP